MGIVRAILFDFDGTLCPTSDIKSGHNDSGMIPQPLKDILNQISLTLPMYYNH